ncbi:hypothetical protein AVEN_142206-1 [Araneus ventricosus]|uniref:Uncharacterized protein n=1 Tax=Araneus ventricosus TaxID=182803 RepID=A0A4Y2SKZ6_ARAVE|nr:hypothetical protein AVEN_142206-1 [Araneus ventricosus]
MTRSKLGSSLKWPPANIATSSPNPDGGYAMQPIYEDGKRHSCEKTLLDGVYKVFQNVNSRPCSNNNR